MSDLDQTFRIGPLATPNFTFNVKLNTILQLSSQEQSTSSIHPCNKKNLHYLSFHQSKLLKNHSLADLSLLGP